MREYAITREAGQHFLAAVPAFITSLELVSDCIYDAYPERLPCPVTQNELGRVPPPFENKACLLA